MEEIKKIILAVVAIIFLAVIVGVISQPATELGKESGKTIKVVDSRGVEVEVKYPSEKIVCLLNSGLNDLYMLGAKDQVIAIDKWTYDTPEVYNYTAQIDERVKDKSLPAIDKNMEQIVGMKPDVVIIWAGQTEDIKYLEDRGIKVVGIQVNNFDDVYKKLEILGKISGKEDRAREIQDYIKKDLKSVEDKTKNIEDDKKLSSIFVWGPTLLDLAGKNSTGNSMLELSGTNNVAGSVEKEHFVAKIEEVIKWNPDTILIWNSPDIDPENYTSDEQWKNVNAVKNKRVYELPDPFYCDLWTVKYVYSVKFAAKQNYPDEFKDIDLEKEGKEMLKFLYKIDFK